MTNTLTTLGWREWLALPDLGISHIAAKIDTGARSSCLHAFSVTEFFKGEQKWVRFGLHPVQDNGEIEVWRDAEVVDERQVTDSGGHVELRYVIRTSLQLGDQSWPIEMTLTKRDTMRFRMLLGRTAMNGHCMVNPEQSWLLGTPAPKALAETEGQWRAEMEPSLQT